MQFSILTMVVTLLAAVSVSADGFSDVRIPPPPEDR